MLSPRERRPNRKPKHFFFVYLLIPLVFISTALFVFPRDQSTSRLLPRPQLLLPACPAQRAGGSVTVSPFPADFWFVKAHKTGSSTLAGVFRTICSHYGIVPVQRQLVHAAQHEDTFQGGRKDGTNISALRKAIHDTYNLTDAPAVAIVNHLKYSDAKAALFRQPLLRFTAVRHPLPRIYSQFFDDTCWRLNAGTGLSNCQQFGSNAALAEKVLQHDTVEHRWEYVKAYKHNHLFNYIRGSATTVEEAVEQYDFIFVAERMDEALVVFMLQYGLTFEDIAFLSAKNNTGKYKHMHEMPQSMNDYIIEANKNDVLLWQLANSRLDALVVAAQQRCGHQVFDGLLQTFKQMQAAVAAECSDYKTWYAQHGFGARPYSYVSDNGMGYRCVDHVAKSFLAQQVL